MKRKSKADELVITHVKGGGPGGQNRNKRATGIRIEHLSTGIRVVATERRSQQMNLSNALERLERKLDAKMKKPTPRKKTHPSAGSQKRRVQRKQLHGAKKKLRGNKNNQWDE